MLKRKRLLIISLALLIMMISGITMAYLTTFTAPKTNTFTLGHNIAISLAEPKWDNLDYSGTTGSIPLNQQGQTLAQNFVPGREIPKNPSVKNTSQNDNNVWIAIKLDYTVGNPGAVAPDPADTYAALDAFADINWSGVGATPGWVAKDTTNTVFYYNTEVAPGANTIDLFDKITIQSTVGFDQLHPFVIKVTAYAVQAEGLGFEDAKTVLDNLIANP